MPPPRVNKKPRNEPTTKDNTGTLDDPFKFLDQDYQELKKSCITNKKRFVDDKFPSDSSSIDPKNKLELDLDQIEWLRPSVSYLYSLSIFRPSVTCLKESLSKYCRMHLRACQNRFTCDISYISDLQLWKDIWDVLKAGPMCIIWM